LGIIFAFWQKATSANREATQLTLNCTKLAEELVASRRELARVQSESSARAGFESLATEREKTIGQLRQECSNLRTDLLAKTNEASDSARIVVELNTKLENERKNLAEKLALLENAKQALAHQFEALAGEILEKKSKSFADGSQKELGNMLTPLRDQIKEFRDKVEQAQTDSKTGVTKLETLIGTLGGLNQQLTEEARNLSTALRGSSKAQGDWGEFILRDLLDKAGLREGEEYSFQQSFSITEVDDSKSRASRTDVVVSLPGGRHLVIDSKVSLNAYTNSVNAESEEARKSALVEHLRSVRKHIGLLGQAGYHDLPGLDTLGFVIMFVPVEPAFFAAIRGDETLWSDAYKQGILLVGPSTLLFVIKIIHELWQKEVESQNYREIMDRGTKLYDKFVGFIEVLDGVGEGIHEANRSFEVAKRALIEGDGNLVRQVEMLRELGVRPKVRKDKGKAILKTIPQKWLGVAEPEEQELALAAVAEEGEDQSQ
jgi:DNA recombination protein RmuC